MICQQQDDADAQVWDDSGLKLTFRRCVNEQLFSSWEDLLSIRKSVVLSDENDVHVWLLKHLFFHQVFLQVDQLWRNVPQF